MSRANNVRGPTSALTEFLKESGINAVSIARRRATQNQQPAGQEAAGPSNQETENNADAGPSNQSQTAPQRQRFRKRTRSRLGDSGHASDDLDHSGPEMGPDSVQNDALIAAAKRRRLTKAAEAKLKAKEKKRRGIKDSDNDDDIDEDDERYNAPSSRPAPGSFAHCAQCEKRFTVTIYTAAAIPGPGWLCHPCAKASGIEPPKKGPTARKKKTVADKRTIKNFEERRFPSLVSLCIQLISKHIDDVESLGDIGTMNVEAISKTLSKNRSLTSENVQLFYSATNTTLTLYDATNLTPDAFSTLGYLNPNLTSLRLDFCGQINDGAFDSLSKSLPALTGIELLGPFLVKPSAWKSFFTAHPNLSSFLITQSPRFDLDCLSCLLTSCGSNLRALRLKEVGKLDNKFLRELSKLGQDGNVSQLNYLDLSEPEESCDDESMIKLLSFIGHRLTYINVSNHILLTDVLLAEGLIPHTQLLHTLILDNLPQLTDKGVSRFFKSWTANPPLVHLSLSRNHALADKSLESILDHSGMKLEELDLNGWKNVGEDILAGFATKARELRRLDVGWIREMSDFVFRAWVDGVPETSVKEKGAVELDEGHVRRKGGCLKLEEVKVWGCNRITLNCPRKKGMGVYGIEAHTTIRGRA